MARRFITALIPIHKMGKAKPGTKNYRSISWTSCMVKLFERIINTSLVPQAGFRAQMTKPYKKEFDNVYTDGVLLKLRRYNISGNMFKWIKSYTHNRRTRGLIDNKSEKILHRNECLKVVFYHQDYLYYSLTTWQKTPQFCRVFHLPLI